MNQAEREYQAAIAQLQEEKQFKENLLQISESFATVQSGRKLTRVILDKMQPLFKFYDIGLFVFNKEKTHLEDWALKFQDLALSDESQEAIKDTAINKPLALLEGSNMAWELDMLEKAKGPVVIDLSDMADQFPRYEQSSVLIEAGYHDSLQTLLRYGGETLGFFCVNSKEKNFFTETQFPLFQAIADQLAVTVSNVLANEQLLEEKQFKETLLGISEAVASIQDRTELFKVIFNEIKPAFKFYDVGLFVFDGLGNVSDWATVTPEISESEVNDMVHQQGIEKITFKGSALEFIFKQVKGKGSALVLPYSDEILSQFPDYYQLEAIKKVGYKEALVGILKTGGEELGILMFNSLQRDLFKPESFPLFQAIADQLAVAVSNVLANEQLLEEKQFKETLLEITEAVAQIQDAQTLYSVIYEKVKPIFHFEAFNIVLLMESHYKVIFTDQRINNPFFSKPIPLPGSPFAQYFEQEPGILVANVEEWLADYPSYPGLQTAKKEGYKQIWLSKLYNGGKLEGCVELVYKTPLHLNHRYRKLLENLTQQIAVAVANIIANEQLLEEKQKTENLLNITESIANINTGPELVRAIFDRLQKVFPFDEAGLFHLDWQHEKERDLVIDYGYEMSISVNEFIAQGLDQWQPMHTLSRLISEKGPLVMHTDTLYEQFDHPHIPFVKEHGYQQIIAGPLIKGDETIGLLYFWSKTAGFFDQKLSVFKSICDQLSVALNNIIANEQLLEEKQFKETLLGISEAVATIQDKSELIKVIFDKVKPIFGFYDVGLFVFHGQGKVSDWATVTPEISESEVNDMVHKQGIEKITFRGSALEFVFDQVKANGSVWVLPYSDEILDRFPGYYQLEAIKKVGYKEALVGILKTGGEELGILIFNSLQHDWFKPESFPLFQAIADQLAVAVSNVLANEAIQQRNLEKSVQISLINSLNKETDWQSRQKKFAHALSQVFPTDFIAFHYAKEDMYEIDAGFEKIGIDGYRAVTLMDFLSKANLSLKDFEKVLKEEEGQLPFILEIAKKAKTGQYLNPVRKKSLELLGLKSVLAVSMQVDNVPFYIYINSKKPNSYHQKHVEMFERIAPSFSQSLEKSLANEEIQKREREKALQVAVINALNRGKTWEDRLLLVARALQDIIPFHLVSFGMVGKRMDAINVGFEQIGADEYRTISIASFLKMSGLKESIFKAQVQAKPYDKVTAVTSGDFVKSAKTHPIIQEMHRVFGINSLMVSPLVINDEPFYISFYHKDSKAYRDHHISLLERVKTSFILALEKLLAYEQIIHLSNQLQQEKDYLQEEVNVTYDFANMVGQTSAMVQVFQQVRQVAASDTTVMVLGETGTGKELIARALHDASPRKDKPLVKLNCAALPESLIESELFGHERGAFTGALKKRIGKFELANKSTIFLDEIGELPLAIQAKLLRVIQEKEFEPLGSNKTIRSDFRLIAATNRNLVAEVQKGSFRQDLFYRLNAFPIILPPLRARIEDIPLLLDHYGNLFAKKLGYLYLGITEASLKKLQSYDWPGNIRELQNLLEQALLTQGAKKLTLTPQPDPLSLTGVSSISTSSLADLEIPENELEDITLKDIDQKKSEVERAYLEAVLQKTKWRISGRHGAAALLDVKAPTLESRLKKLGIRR